MPSSRNCIGRCHTLQFPVSLLLFSWSQGQSLVLVRWCSAERDLPARALDKRIRWQVCQPDSRLSASYLRLLNLPQVPAPPLGPPPHPKNPPPLN